MLVMQKFGAMENGVKWNLIAVIRNKIRSILIPNKCLQQHTSTLATLTNTMKVHRVAARLSMALGSDSYPLKSTCTMEELLRQSAPQQEIKFATKNVTSSSSSRLRESSTQSIWSNLAVEPTQILQQCMKCWRRTREKRLSISAGREASLPTKRRNTFF